MSTTKESQDELWNEVYRDFQDIFDYRQSSKQRDKWFEDVKKEYFVGRTIVDDDDYSYLNKTKFRMSCLSLTLGTYIASEFNSYVVKIKLPLTNSNSEKLNDKL